MRWLLSWMFYWLGDLFSKLDYVVYWLYKKLENLMLFANCYQWCMGVAAKLQGNGKGPWVNAKEYQKE